MRFIYFILVVSLILSCGKNNSVSEKVNITTETAGSWTTAADLTFKDINEKVLKPYCVSCHKAAKLVEKKVKPKLVTYADVMAFVSAGNPEKPAGSTEPDKKFRFYGALEDGSMPAKTPGETDDFPKELIDLVKTWIEQGAKEN